MISISTKQLLTEFIAKCKQDSEGKGIIFLTSGGTSIPLEKNTVRSIENFSSGKRGALMTEYFLQNDYYVILYTNERCLQPFHHYFTKEELFLMTEESEEYSKFIKVRELYHKYKDRLLKVNYFSILDYLRGIESISKILFEEQQNSLNENKNLESITIMAAAVSDFYIPEEKLSTHKIQSGENEDGLTIALEPVPKKLKKFTEEWNPLTIMVSFKLETDEEILLSKAKSALKKYGVHLVIANELHSRYEKAYIVKDDEISGVELISLTEEDKKEEVYIEKHIVQKIIDFHQSFKLESDEKESLV